MIEVICPFCNNKCKAIYRSCLFIDCEDKSHPKLSVDFYTNMAVCRISFDKYYVLYEINEESLANRYYNGKKISLEIRTVDGVCHIKNCYFDVFNLDFEEKIRKLLVLS